MVPHYANVCISNSSVVSNSNNTATVLPRVVSPRHSPLTVPSNDAVPAFENFEPTPLDCSSSNNEYSIAMECDSTKLLSSSPSELLSDSIEDLDLCIALAFDEGEDLDNLDASEWELPLPEAGVMFNEDIFA